MIRLSKILSEIKIVGKNFIKKINTFNEYLELTSNFPKEYRDKRLFKMYDRDGLYYIKYNGEEYFIGKRYYDISDKYNHQVNDNNLRTELLKFFKSEYDKNLK